jgi:hypothetical protein
MFYPRLINAGVRMPERLRMAALYQFAFRNVNASLNLTMLKR